MYVLGLSNLLFGVALDLFLRYCKSFWPILFAFEEKIHVPTFFIVARYSQSNRILILGRVVDSIVASNVVFRGCFCGSAPHDPTDKDL